MEGFIALATPLVLNGVMGALKWLGAQDMSMYGKRALLAAFAIIGVLASSVITGIQPDMNTLSGFVNVLLLAGLNFIAAHGSYTLFWKK